MAKLTDELIDIINDSESAFIATADREGKPNVSPKGLFRVLDGEHVVYGEIASPRTLENLKENPHVTAIIFDRAYQNGCRIRGTAKIKNGGKLFDKMVTNLAGNNIKIRHAVVVEVDEFRVFRV